MLKTFTGRRAQGVGPLIVDGFEFVYRLAESMPEPTVPAEPDQPTDHVHKLATDTLRAGLSPRHVPDRVIIAPEIPYTRTGKKLEVPVKRLLQGANPAAITSPGTLANPDSLTFYRPSLLTR